MDGWVFSEEGSRKDPVANTHTFCLEPILHFAVSFSRASDLKKVRCWWTAHRSTLNSPRWSSTLHFAATSSLLLSPSLQFRYDRIRCYDYLFVLLQVLLRMRALVLGLSFSSLTSSCHQQKQHEWHGEVIVMTTMMRITMLLVLLELDMFSLFTHWFVHQANRQSWATAGTGGTRQPSLSKIQWSSWWWFFMHIRQCTTYHHHDHDANELNHTHTHTCTVQDHPAANISFWCQFCCGTAPTWLI